MSKNWLALWIIVIVLVIPGVAAFIFDTAPLPDFLGFSEYRGPTDLEQGQPFERQKTLWDIWSLAAIPAALFLGAHYLSRSARKEELEEKESDSQDAALQAYLSAMRKMVVDEEFLDADSAAWDVARSMTENIVGSLDGRRKATLVLFLYDMRLIKKGPEKILKVSGFDFSNIDFENRGENLNEIILAGADLEEANFANCELKDANLFNTGLKNADLRNANLKGAELGGNSLAGAKLTGVQQDSSTNWPLGFTPP